MARVRDREGPTLSSAPMRPPSFLLAAVLVPLACGSSAKPPKPVDPGEPALCRITTTQGTNKPLADRALPPAFWFSLMLRGYEATGAIARPVRDCEGQVASWTV